MSGGLGLRARLAAFFIAITVVPLGLATAALHVSMGREIEQRNREELASARSAVVALLEVERDRAGDVAGDLAQRLALSVGAGLLPARPTDDAAVADEWLRAAAASAVPERADFVLLADAQGRVVAEVVDEPRFSDPDVAPDLDDLPSAVAEGRPVVGALVEARELRGSDAEEPFGWLLAGRWADDGLLADLRLQGEAALVAGRTVLGSTDPAVRDLPVETLRDGQPQTVEIDGEEVIASAAPLRAGSDLTHLVLWADARAGPSLLVVGLIVLLPAVLAAGALGWLLASSVIAPIRRAADAARAVASGDLGRKLPAGGGAELAELAYALNTMGDQLAERLDELHRSRDRLRGSLDRLGQTLSSSLDLNATLSVVVETAMEILGAERGLLMLHTPERDALYLKVGRGIGQLPPRIPVGEGRIGLVAERGRSARLPADADALPPPCPGEPEAAHELIVPLHGRGLILGVLALLRDDPDRGFGATDLKTLESFATQASVAIENVLLHREARRLSVTDSLTGLWNFRYFELQADRELESASRSGRPLSLMIIDIDHFKSVNDDYGHQVGDAVLTEVAARIRNATRTPDIVARYGGEEFVVLLPGTEVDGGLATGERVRDAVGRDPIPVERGLSDDGLPLPPALPITCSVGVATFPTHGDTVAALLRSADAAMYRAKQQGRNRVVGAEASEV